MALQTTRVNGTSQGTINATWYNDFMQLLTGVMTDQAVNIKYVPGAGTTPALTLTSKAGNQLIRGYKPDTTTEAFHIDENGKFSFEQGAITSDGFGDVSMSSLFIYGSQLAITSSSADGGSSGTTPKIRMSSTASTMDFVMGAFGVRFVAQNGGSYPSVASIDNNGNLYTAATHVYGVLDLNTARADPGNAGTVPTITPSSTDNTLQIIGGTGGLKLIKNAVSGYATIWSVDNSGNVTITGTIGVTGVATVGTINAATVTASANISATGTVTATGGLNPPTHGNITAVGTFGGTGSGTFSHGLGATPTFAQVTCNVSGSQTQGQDTVGSTTIHITSGGGLGFGCIVGRW